MNNSNFINEIFEQMKITNNRLLANKFWMIGGLLFTLLFIVYGILIILSNQKYQSIS